jgi:hypothetical protein
MTMYINYLWYDVVKLKYTLQKYSTKSLTWRIDDMFSYPFNFKNIEIYSKIISSIYFYIFIFSIKYILIIFIYIFTSILKYTNHIQSYNMLFNLGKMTINVHKLCIVWCCKVEACIKKNSTKSLTWRIIEISY